MIEFTDPRLKSHFGYPFWVPFIVHFDPQPQAEVQAVDLLPGERGFVGALRPGAWSSDGSIASALKYGDRFGGAALGLQALNPISS